MVESPFTFPWSGRSRVGPRRGRWSRHHLAQGSDLERVEMVADRARNEARGDRRAVVMQDRHQADRVDAALVDDERAQLAVAVLLHDEHEVVVRHEARHAREEWKSAHAQPAERVLSTY